MLALCSSHKVCCCCCSHLKAVARRAAAALAGGEWEEGWRIEKKQRIGGTSAGTWDAVRLLLPCLCALLCSVLTDHKALAAMRLNASCAERQYYFNPAGKRFRSRQEVRRLHHCMPAWVLLHARAFLFHNFIPACPPACWGTHAFSHSLPCTLAHMCHHARPDGRTLQSRS